MAPTSRRNFLQSVGSGMLVAGLGAGLVQDLGFSTAFANEGPESLAFGKYDSLVDQSSFELGVIHYASDTPYSRRQSLLSKSMSYFGMESTYGCAIAIARRIFASELSRLDED